MELNELETQIGGPTPGPSLCRKTCHKEGSLSFIIRYSPEGSGSPFYFDLVGIHHSHCHPGLDPGSPNDVLDSDGVNGVSSLQRSVILNQACPETSGFGMTVSVFYGSRKELIRYDGHK